MSNSRRSAAVLAVWNDCAPERKDAYEQWYEGEHLAERVAIPGFRTGRRWAAVSAGREFLTTYEADDTWVFSSIEYLDRLAHPTPDTAAIMRDGFLNTSRTICRRIAPRGSVRGAVVVTAAVEEPSPETALAAVVRQYPVSHAVAHTEVWVSAGAPHGGVSAEQAIRGGEDQMISGCVTVELLREGDALLVAADIRRALPRAEVGVYRLLCSLGKEDLQCESC